jgi:hypothetical protein
MKFPRKDVPCSLDGFQIGPLTASSNASQIRKGTQLSKFFLAAFLLIATPYLKAAYVPPLDAATQARIVLADLQQNNTASTSVIARPKYVREGHFKWPYILGAAVIVTVVAAVLVVVGTFHGSAGSTEWGAP